MRWVALECEPSVHGSAAAAPSAQYEPGVHGSHTSWPGLAWKVPGSHLRHVPMFVLGATVPGPHGVCLVLPVDAKWPLSVGVHSAALVRLVALECEPYLQGSAAAAPSAQYEPGVHGSLTSWPGLA